MKTPTIRRETVGTRLPNIKGSSDAPSCAVLVMQSSVMFSSGFFFPHLFIVLEKGFYDVRETRFLSQDNKVLS